MKRSVLMAIGLLAGCNDFQADELVASRADELSVAPATRAYAVARTATAARAVNRTVISESGKRRPSHWPLRLATPAARAEQPGGGADIVGGEPHTGNPEVPIILMLDAAQNVIAICSGTLIEPRLVLTAAHCVDGVVPAVGYGVYFGTDALVENDPGGLFFTMAESVVFHPDWNPDDLAAGNDIGLIHLVDEVPITPAAIRTAPLAAGDIGASVHLVGWGITGGGLDDSGVKRHVFSTLDDFNVNLVVVGNPETNTCSGDSGGPAFLEVGGAEQVVGVTSFGDENCEIQGVSTRVDAFVDFIAANSEPGGPGPGGGGFGDPCADASECDSGVCVTGAGAAEGFCSSLCDAATSCPGGSECVAVDAENSVCVPAEQPGGGAGQLGDACTAGADCASGLCATDADGNGICTEECDGLLDCADGFSCEQVEGGSVCLPADDVSGGFPTPIPNEDEGGCSAAGGAGGPAALLLVLVALALLPEGRRARRSRRRPEKQPRSPYGFPQLARVAQRRPPPPRSLPD